MISLSNKRGNRSCLKQIWPDLFVVDVLKHLPSHSENALLLEAAQDILGIDSVGPWCSKHSDERLLQYGLFREFFRHSLPISFLLHSFLALLKSLLNGSQFRGTQRRSRFVDPFSVDMRRIDSTSLELHCFALLRLKAVNIEIPQMA